MKTTNGTPILEPETMADVIEHLGGISPDRIRMNPLPGQASEADVIAAAEAPRKRLCELIDGILVEKAMGSKESVYGAYIGRRLGNFVDEDDLGVVLGADGMLRLAPGLVRIPDVCFIPWGNIPGEEMSEEAIATYVPDLIVEVLSPSNTRAEIDRKLRDCFLAGTRLAWVIQPKTQTAQIYTSPTDYRRVPKTGSLLGEPVLPGFVLPLPDVFSRTRSRRKRKK